ncbi:MAG: hypothetical protein ABEJ87_04095 [Candidatus Nanohalobium sp.]
MIPITAIDHFIWAGLIFLSFYTVYRKYQENQNEMLKNFYMFFLVWSTGFFGLMASMFTLGAYLGNDMILSLGYVIPHIFAFVSIGYLWKVQSSINFPKYQKLFWVFVGYGVLLVGYGLLNRPDVAVQDGVVTYGGSMFSSLIPLGMTVSAVLISGSSFYSAYVTKGDTRRKLVLIGIGTMLSLVFGSIFHNLGYKLLGEATNLVWISIFLAVTHWQMLQEKLSGLRGE